jgi:membrane protein involved in colicin uptake
LQKAGLEKKKAMDEDALAKSAARKKSKMKAGNEMAFGKAEIQAVNEAMRVKLSPTHAPTLLPPCASENATQKSHALCSTPADRAKWKADQKRKASAPVHAAAPVMPPASEPSAGATRGGAAHNDAPDSALNDFLSSLKGIEGAVNSASTSSKQAQSIGGEHSLGGLLALVGAVICVGAATVGYELKKRGVNVIGGSGQQEYTSIPNGNTAIAEKPDSDEEV